MTKNQDRFPCFKPKKEREETIFNIFSTASSFMREKKEKKVYAKKTQLLFGKNPT